MSQITDRIAGPRVKGRVGLWRILELGQEGRNQYPPKQLELIFQQSNQIQYDWGYVAAQSIGVGDRNFRISSLYIEYENVTLPGDPVTPPTFSRDEGVEYYTDLAFSGARDFLRVPLLVEPSIGIAPGFEEWFTEGVDGNQLTFYTQTQGTAGFNGKPFSAAANSKVFGAALVATPVFADQTQDIVFARTYFDTADQEVKSVSKQFGVTWDIAFE
jgi:hypothetical protein